MNQKRVAVYAGSFDPPTNGHLWMIEQGAKMFDKLIVAIGVNPNKKYTFSVDERIQMLKDSVKGCPNVSIDQFNNKYLVKYAQSIGADFILRGIRNSADFNFEQGMNNINRDINSNINTVFLMPPRELCEISSSFVKGLIGPEGWQTVVSQYIPKPVFDKIKR
jgi:pantetheine-phosphate adenylyltransferase